MNIQLQYIKHSVQLYLKYYLLWVTLYIKSFFYIFKIYSLNHKTKLTKKHEIENKKTFFLDRNKFQNKSSQSSTYKFGLSVCLSVCLYPINVKTAEPIGPKFFVGHLGTPGKV